MLDNSKDEQGRCRIGSCAPDANPQKEARPTAQGYDPDVAPLPVSRSHMRTSGLSLSLYPRMSSATTSYSCLKCSSWCAHENQASGKPCRNTMTGLGGMEAGGPARTVCSRMPLTSSQLWCRPGTTSRADPSGACAALSGRCVPLMSL